MPPRRSACAISSFRKDESGAAITEFALIGLILFTIILCVFELTMIMHSFMKADDAVRRAVRRAVLGTPIIEVGNLTATPVTCAMPSTTVSCSGGAAANAASFQAIVAAAQGIDPNVQARNLRVIYRTTGVGWGLTGDGTAAMVTVELTGYQYRPAALSMVGVGNIAFPLMATSRVLETQ